MVVEDRTGKKHRVVIERVEDDDYKKITKTRYFFDWKLEREEEVYKLVMTETNDILGLISIEYIPEEWRIHVRLFSVSKENSGRDKEYENIAGNLLTFVSQIAIREYAELACVSLMPKGAIAQHYIDKFGMNVTGVTLSIELPQILELINTYDHD